MRISGRAAPEPWSRGRRRTRGRRRGGRGPRRGGPGGRGAAPPGGRPRAPGWGGGDVAGGTPAEADRAAEAPDLGGVVEGDGVAGVGGPVEVGGDADGVGGVGGADVFRVDACGAGGPGHGPLGGELHSESFRWW